MNDSARPTAYLNKAKDDLAQARLLFGAGYADGTCNRAYYALYNAIMALLYVTDSPAPKTHTGAHTTFRRAYIQTGLFPQTFSNTITELFNMRQGGDYELDFDISTEDAQSAVDQATEFLRQTEAYLRTNGFTA